jgi:phosphoribosylformimino-5-aminoimidazole carboxamide ribotide isomerase
MILVIPSIDIKNGRCVRLVRGIPGTEKRYSDDPVQMAILWRGENAKMLHVADLDGALGGTMTNFDLIKKIIQEVEIPIEVSGGVRTYGLAKDLFEAGAARVVLSTAVMENPDVVRQLLADFSPRKVVVAIDASNSTVQPREREERPRSTSVSLGLKAKLLGLERALYTNISRNGTLSGPSFSAIEQFALETRLKITASGGVGGYQDLRRLQELEPLGVDSVVVGRALYENRFPCQELWRQCEGALEDLGPTRRL